MPKKKSKKKVVSPYQKALTHFSHGEHERALALFKTVVSEDAGIAPMHDALKYLASDDGSPEKNRWNINYFAQNQNYLTGSSMQILV